MYFFKTNKRIGKPESLGFEAFEENIKEKGLYFDDKHYIYIYYNKSYQL